MGMDFLVFDSGCLLSDVWIVVLCDDVSLGWFC
jgi:hypothetical protein